MARSHTVFALVLGLALAMFAGACSGSPQDADLSPDQMIAEVLCTLESDKSAAFTVHVELDQFIAVSFELDGTGVMLGPDSQVEGSVESSGPPGSDSQSTSPIKLLVANGRGYTSDDGGEWTELGDGWIFMSFADPATQLRLLENPESVSDVGVEDIDGVTCRHLVVEPDSVAYVVGIWADVGGMSEEMLRSQLETSGTPEDVSVSMDVWAEVDTYRLRRLTLTDTDAKTTFDFYDHGEPVEIDAPAE